jgi:hypothetical protein
MADIICAHCGEPWDIDEVHCQAEEDGTDFGTVFGAFKRSGCSALGFRCLENTDAAQRARGALFAALLDLGDVDGAIAEFEDFEGLL